MDPRTKEVLKTGGKVLQRPTGMGEPWFLSEIPPWMRCVYRLKNQRAIGYSQQDIEDCESKERRRNYLAILSSIKKTCDRDWKSCASHFMKTVLEGLYDAARLDQTFTIINEEFALTQDSPDWWGSRGGLLNLEILTAKEMQEYHKHMVSELDYESEEDMLKDKNHLVKKKIQEMFATKAKSPGAAGKRKQAAVDFILATTPVTKILSRNRRRSSWQYYIYHDGIYMPGMALIKQAIRDLLGCYNSTHNEKEILLLIKGIKATPKKEIERCRYYLGVENGILDLKPLEKGEDPCLLPFNKDLFVTKKIPVTYDPDILYKQQNLFLESIVDRRRPQDAETLRRAMGFCLWPDYQLHKAFLLIGEGANGKGTFLHVLESLIGQENAAHVSPLAMGNDKFAMAELNEAMINTVDDLEEGDLKNTGNFKSATGQGILRGQFKNEDAFYFYCLAKLICCANRVPMTKDYSRGFFRRWIIINFPYDFEKPGAADRKIREKITTPEMLSGWLNLALSGLKSLLVEGKFNDDTTEDVMRYFERASDPIGRFLDECCDVISFTYENGRRVSEEYVAPITKKDVYQYFKKYCKKNRIPALPENKLHALMRKMEPGLSTTRIRVEGSESRPRAYTNLSVRNPDEML